MTYWLENLENGTDHSDDWFVMLGSSPPAG